MYSKNLKVCTVLLIGAKNALTYFHSFCSINSDDAAINAELIKEAPLLFKKFTKSAQFHQLVPWMLPYTVYTRMPRFGQFLRKLRIRILDKVQNKILRPVQKNTIFSP